MITQITHHHHSHLSLPAGQPPTTPGTPELTDHGLDAVYTASCSAEKHAERNRGNKPPTMMSVSSTITRVETNRLGQFTDSSPSACLIPRMSRQEAVVQLECS